jgi:hypothetical protein
MNSLATVYAISILLASVAGIGATYLANKYYIIQKPIDTIPTPTIKKE